MSMLTLCILILTLAGSFLPGTHATQNPYFVSIQSANDQNKLCGGVIINNKWILSPGNCFIGVSAPWKYFVNAGIDKTHDVGPNVQKIEVIAIYVHPEYISNNPISTNDMALLHLKDELKFNDHVKAIDLPTETYNPTGAGNIIGWKSTSTDNGETQDKVVSEPTSVIPKEKCEILGASLDVTQIVCLGDPTTSVAPCAGESGGPFVQTIGGKPTVVGVTAFGQQRCGSLPSAQTHIAHYLKWISDTMKQAQ